MRATSSRIFRALVPPGLAAALVIAVMVPSPALANATITIVNGNLPGVGFNDPTPVTPVGGNPGVTRGQQRLIAFQFAADIWGSTLDSNVQIQVLATFEPLSCNSTAATLGSAGTRFIFANFGGQAPFPGAAFSNTWHHQALANKRAGVQLNPGEADIRARFNVNLGNPGCLTGIGWYLGLDRNHGSQIDLVTVLLHEFGHGLGFSQFASLSSGAQTNGFTDVYGRNLLDLTLGRTWNQMSNAERAASAVNSRKVVWIGPEVTDGVPDVLAPGTPLMYVSTPPAVAGYYDVGRAQFGAPLTGTAVGGDVVLGLDTADASGPSTSDACSPLTNAASVTGRIALVDRGTCTFVAKVKNAQNAGAIAVVVADNAAGAPPPDLGGTDPTITIPSVRITRDAGIALKAQLSSGVTASLLVDPAVYSGADPSGRALMNAPSPVQQGSSISHWDPIAFPNQLMEPAINGDLSHSLSGVDLSLALMRDVGWFADADVDGVASDVDNCPENANPGQENLDGDAQGDVCDLDDDSDGVADTLDGCPTVVPDRGLDADRDGCTDTLATLRSMVEGTTTLPRVRFGLLAKLNEAANIYARGDVDAAMNVLQAFIYQVEGQRGGGISDETADLLTAYARNVIALMST